MDSWASQANFHAEKAVRHLEAFENIRQAIANEAESGVASPPAFGRALAAASATQEQSLRAAQAHAAVAQVCLAMP